MYKLKIWIHRHFPVIRRRALRKAWDRSNYEERVLMTMLGLASKSKK